MKRSWLLKFAATVLITAGVLHTCRTTVSVVFNLSMLRLLQLVRVPMT
jgi:hypothetical protein